MASKMQIQIIIGIAVVVWGALLLVQGVTLHASYLRPFSIVVGVVIIVLAVFDRWLWRFRPFSWILPCPVLRGTWRGQLRSNWIDPATNQGIAPIDAFLVIRQTYSTISMRMMTKESTSRSVVASLETPRNDVARASSTYQNEPSLLIQDRSRIHHGALMLEVHGSPANRLTGSYWTDRDTKGEVSLGSRSKKLYTNFDEAVEADSWTEHQT
jgi:hypothetical protein